MKEIEATRRINTYFPGGKRGKTRIIEVNLLFTWENTKENGICYWTIGLPPQHSQIIGHASIC